MIYYPYRAIKQALKHRLRLRAESCMDGRHLDDGAAGSDEPVKARSLRKLTYGAGLRAAVTDDGDYLQKALDLVGVERRIKRQQARPVKVNARFQKSLIRAREDNAGIDKFFALYARHNANDGVVKGAKLRHLCYC